MRKASCSWFGGPALRAGAIALSLLCGAATGWAQPPATEAAPTSKATAAHKVDPYIRVVDDREANTVTLELASRRFVDPAGKLPELHVAGAVHIADSGFYKQLQEMLDAKDVVLFEGVKPGGVENGDAAASDAEKAELTGKRLRLLATLIEGHRRDHGSLPESLDALETVSDKRISWLVGAVRTDAWGEAVRYTREIAAARDEARRFDVVSLGADKAEGGEGPAADLAYSKQPPLKDDELGEGGPGLQQQLASSLGLKFQLDEMDHGKPNWRNSDMTIDEVQKRLEAAGGNGADVLGMLDGSSISAKVAGVLLRMIGSSPTMSALTKVMLLEMLTRADELISATPGMEGLSEVLLIQRNAVVLEDLQRIAEREPGVRSVGIIYGAGHLPDMERRLIKEFGYKPAESTWRPAIKVDLKKAGISASQADQMRRMIRSTIDRQLNATTKPKKAGAGARSTKPAAEPKSVEPASTDERR